MKIYIAGPMTGIEDFNYPAFNAAAKQLRAAGYEVVNPAEIDQETGENKPWEDYMRASLKQMLDCEAVAVLDNWIGSRGAKIEVALASNLKMLVKPLAFYLEAEHRVGVKNG